MSVTDRVQADMAAAAKSGDRVRLGTLRLVLDSLKKAAKEARGELDEQGEIAVLKRERKRRSEAAEAFRSAGRQQAAEAEQAEAALIDAYLPEQISDADLAALVDDALAQTGARSQKEIGRVMSAVMPKLGGRADGKRVNALVRERLAAGDGGEG